MDDRAYAVLQRIGRAVDQTELEHFLAKEGAGGHDVLPALGRLTASSRVRRIDRPDLVPSWEAVNA